MPGVAARRPPEPYSSQAWLLHGLFRSEPGVLQWTSDRLRFTTENDVVFDIEPANLFDVVFPWYYFGGGFTFRTAERRYRLSFVRPNGAEVAVMRGAAAAGSPLALVGAAEKIVDIRSGRRVGQRWRDILTGIGPEGED